PLENGVRLIQHPLENKISSPKQENTLINHLTSPTRALEHLLSGIYIANTLSEALEQAQHLEPHESVITKDGIWIGSSWLKTPDVKDERSGMIARGQRIEALEQEITQQQTQLLDHEE